ncbi:MAG: hypothetical protein ACYCSX_10755 [Acidimicrobiales bacterium]|jgi:hypothetical protein
MRAPLALRLSAATRAALVRKARAAGIDSTEDAFAAFVGDLLTAELPHALADAADRLVGAPARERLAAHLPRNAQRPEELTPGRASDPATDAVTSVPGFGPEPELGPGGTPA